MPIHSIPGFHEPFSSISHLLGALVFLFLSLIIIWRGWGDRGRVAFLAVYACSSMVLFSMSGVFHLLVKGTTASTVLQRLDHAAIFLLIAGTFTAVHGIVFHGWMRWIPLILIWATAITGITLKSIFFNDMSEEFGLVLYLAMGWIGFLSATVMWYRFGTRFMLPLVWGALAYTIGAVCDFARWPVLIPGVAGPHEFFHLMVLAGAIFQWQFVYQFAHGQVPAPRGEALQPASPEPSVAADPTCCDESDRVEQRV